MAKCFFTGTESPVQEMFVLDAAAAKRAVLDLRQRLVAVERLLSQLNVKDDVEIYDARASKTISIKKYRLVSGAVAEALSAGYPEAKLFMTWNAWQDRRLVLRKMQSREDQAYPNNVTAKSADASEGGTP
ncbi:MAG: hypothetical protein JXR40_00550 [Pontiellaceae bacterium]|nr:hypothetical protein [Pontiellaceae bacterium]